MEATTTFTANPELFTNSHNFTINGGQFCAFSESSHGQKVSNSRTQDFEYGFRVISRDELRTLSVICTRKGYRFNSTKQKGHGDLDMVQVFEGAEAKEMWQRTIEFSRCLVNAHVLAISGISPSTSSSSDPHYIVFDGAGSRNTYRVIASMLRRGDMEATVIRLRAVYGITSGLDYISQTVLPLPELRIDEFVAFSDDFGHTRLTFTPNALTHLTTMNRQSLLSAGGDVEICYALIRKIFSDANHTIHRDEVDHHLNEELLLSSAPHLKTYQNTETPTKNTPQDEATLRPPRREIIWNTLGFSDLPLSYIYQNYNDLIFSNDTVQLPRRFGRNLIGYRHACSCEGYIREEITLTPDTFQNAVLIYRQPSPNERCGLCGKLLENIEEKANLSDSVLYKIPHTPATMADSLHQGDDDGMSEYAFSDGRSPEYLEEELYAVAESMYQDDDDRMFEYAFSDGRSPEYLEEELYAVAESMYQEDDDRMSEYALSDGRFASLGQQYEEEESYTMDEPMYHDDDDRMSEYALSDARFASPGQQDEEEFYTMDEPMYQEDDDRMSEYTPFDDRFDPFW